MRRQIDESLGQMLTAASSLAINSRVILFTLMFYLGNNSKGSVLGKSFPESDALLCYECDILSDPACNQYFMAYQFRPTHCPDKPNGDKPWCGKQQQPPLANGWVGVIRSCYYPGDLPDMNETIGCHHHVISDTNFSAVYCLCERDLCNAATSALLSRFSFRKQTTWPTFITHALSQLLMSALTVPLFLTGSVLVAPVLRGFAW